MYGRMISENSKTTTSSSSSRDEEIEWEMRPGGMLVQKRIDNSPEISSPNLWLRISFGVLRYEISVNSRATFGNIAGSIFLHSTSLTRRALFSVWLRGDKHFVL